MDKIDAWLFFKLPRAKPQAYCKPPQLMTFKFGRHPPNRTAHPHPTPRTFVVPQVRGVRLAGVAAVAVVAALGQEAAEHAVLCAGGREVRPGRRRE